MTAETTTRPELTYSLVRHWTKMGTVCAWCEVPMTEHVKLWKDGYRWTETAGRCINPVELIELGG